MTRHPIRVTIFHEFRHEKWSEEVRNLYPEGMHVCLGKTLSDAGFEVTLATLDEPEHGLTDEVLSRTDVLLWWAHCTHHLIEDTLVEKIADRVFNYGMGFIPLHSSHKSKPFQRIVGTSGNLLWGDNQKEILWTALPSHPIAEGLPEQFSLPSEEMYGEPFMIPQPDATVFLSWFEHGNVFRSGCCFLRGLGKVFYFQPGHETCPTYHDENVKKILVNAVKWAAPVETPTCRFPSDCPYYPPLV